MGVATVPALVAVVVRHGVGGVTRPSGDVTIAIITVIIAVLVSAPAWARLLGLLPP
jgi:hypothetical protein